MNYRFDLETGQFKDPSQHCHSLVACGGDVSTDLLVVDVTLNKSSLHVSSFANIETPCDLLDWRAAHSANSGRRSPIPFSAIRGGRLQLHHGQGLFQSSFVLQQAIRLHMNSGMTVCGQFAVSCWVSLSPRSSVAVQLFLKSSYALRWPTAIPQSMLSKGTAYNFVVTLCNFLGKRNQSIE